MARACDQSRWARSWWLSPSASPMNCSFRALADILRSPRKQLDHSDKDQALTLASAPTSRLSCPKLLEALAWAACSAMVQRCEARWSASSASSRPAAAAVPLAPRRAAAAPSGGRRQAQRFRQCCAAAGSSGPAADPAPQQPQQQAVKPPPSFAQPPPPQPPPPAWAQPPPPRPATPQFAQPPPGRTSHTADLCEYATAIAAGSRGLPLSCSAGLCLPGLQKLFVTCKVASASPSPSPCAAAPCRLQRISPHPLVWLCLWLWRQV